MRPFGLTACLLLFVLVAGIPMVCSIDPPEDFEYGSEDAAEFTDFFAMEAPAASGVVESYNPAGREPSSVRLADRSTSYASYQSTYMGTNSLWIMGSSSWAQRVVCPLGAYLSLLAYSSSGGRADFYEIYPDGRLLLKSYSFYPGYSRLIFEADEVGRHILVFVVNNQPSNVVIVDVASGGWPPSPGPGPSTWPSAGSARVIFSSSWLRGYSVFVDGSYVGGDGQGGDLLDGTYSLNVAGNQYHILEISSGGQTYSEQGTFLTGYTYKLNL
jgi:hypothetical protein